MKRHYILFSLFLFLIFTTVQSQDAQSFGLKSGITLTTLSNQDALNIKPGLQVGAFAKLGGRQSLFFKGEFLITQKGSWNWSSNNPRNFSFFYVDLPIMFGIDVFRGLSINAGIQPSMLIAGSLKTSEGGSTNRRSLGGDIERFDYSILIGAEYFIKEYWFLGVRFNHSYAPLQDHHRELSQAIGGQLLENRVLQFYVGYVFN